MVVSKVLKDRERFKRAPCGHRGACGVDNGLLDLDGGDAGQLLKVQGLEQVLGLGIDLDGRGVESRDLGDVVVLALTLLLLKLEGDTADGTTLDTLHQVSGVTGDLVAQALGGNDGDLIANALVGLEVQSELGVVALNDDLRRSLDSLGADSSHFGGLLLAGFVSRLLWF